jgi:hypothetical protein
MRARVFAVHIHSVNHITARSGTPTSRVSKQSLNRVSYLTDPAYAGRFDANPLLLPHAAE